MSLFDRLRRLLTGTAPEPAAEAQDPALPPAKWRIDTSGVEGLRGHLDPAVRDAIARIEALDLPVGLPPAEVERLVREAILADQRQADLPDDPGFAALGLAPLPLDSEATVPVVMAGSWRLWSAWMAGLQVPLGWAPCRFGVRSGDMIQPVYGMVRGDFGVYSAVFRLCGAAAGPFDGRHKPLALLAHLPSGLNVGMFVRREVAVEAADLALSLAWDNPSCWRQIDPGDAKTYDGIIDRLRRLWASAGFVLAPYHAHNIPGAALDHTTGEVEVAPGTEPANTLADSVILPIWMITDVTRNLNKPPKERLS